MTDKNFKLPDGLTDYLPEDCFQKNYLESTLVDTFNLYGFKRVDTPVFEYIDRFIEGAGISELFKFSDIDGELLALRSDMTLPIARLAGTKGVHGAKYSYIASSYTLQRRMGRDREFAQVGVEIVGGAQSASADAELIALNIKSLLNTGLTDFLIDIGHVALKDELNPKTLKPYELFGGVEVLKSVSGKVKSEKAKNAICELLELYKNLEFLEVCNYINFDLRLTDANGYYSGVVFKSMAKQGGANLAGGGRYTLKDGISGIGFAIGIKRLSEVLKKSDKLPKMQGVDFAIGAEKTCVKEAFEYAKELRDSGKTVDNTFINDKTEFNRYADETGAKNKKFFGGGK